MCFGPQRRALFRHLNFQKCSGNGVFCTFWLGDMCFAPQRRALFRHPNFEKWSETVSLLHFWLRHVLRATTACNFSSLIWPDGSAPAALARLLFDLPEPQIIGKTPCVATLLPFRAPASSFLWLFLFCDLHFSSLLFSDPSHLCFSICPYCRKFGFWASFDYSICLYLVISYYFPHIFVWSSCFWFCISLLVLVLVLLLLLPLRCLPVTHHLSHTTLSHPSLSHTQLCPTSSFTHNFVTHNLSCTTLSHTTLSRTTLLHTIFHTQLCHTQLCHTPLCHTPSFTQLCHTQLRLSHTTLSHTNFITHSSTQTFSHTPSFNTNFLTQCVAGVALGDIDVPFAWQAWHLATSTAWQAWRLWHWAGSGGALGTPRHFAWQAWRLCSHPPLFCVAGVALGEMYLRLAWQVWHLWHWAGSGGVLGRRVSHSPGAPRHFAWRAWHSAALTPHLRGSRGTWWHLPAFGVAGVALVSLVARLVAVSRPERHGTLRGRHGAWWHRRSICVASLALGDIDVPFAWQAWHLATCTCVWSGRRGTCGTCGTGLALVACLVAALVTRPGRRGTLHGRRGAWWHRRSICVAGVALGDIYLRLAWQVWHLCHWAGSGGALGRYCACRAKCIFTDCFWNCGKTLTFFAHFWQGAQSLAPATQDHIWTSKSAP